MGSQNRNAIAIGIGILVVALVAILAAGYLLLGWGSKKDTAAADSAAATTTAPAADTATSTSSSATTTKSTTSTTTTTSTTAKKKPSTTPSTPTMTTVTTTVTAPPAADPYGDRPPRVGEPGWKDHVPADDGSSIVGGYHAVCADDVWAVTPETSCPFALNVAKDVGYPPAGVGEVTVRSYSPVTDAHYIMRCSHMLHPEKLWDCHGGDGANVVILNR